jgi:hypothetical protein
MVERLRRALGHIDFRIFLWLTPVVIAATVLGSLGQGSTAGPEEDTIGNWAELALKVGSDLRSGDEWRLIVPEEEVQPDRIKATLLQKGLAGLQETPHWYWGFDLGVLYFPDGSVIAGAVTSGTQVVVYEDMASGTLGIASLGSSVGRGTRPR